MENKSKLYDATLAMYEKISDSEGAKISALAQEAKKTIENGGVLFVFGSGHSGILVEEAFHRAGGLIPVVPMMQSFLSPYTAPKISGKLERLGGVANVLFEKYKPTSKDLVFIVSNSGVNAVSVEMAEECKKNSVKSIALTSLEHSNAAKSRHKDGKKLFELVDIVLDNHSPAGDGLFEIGGVKVCAASTLANVFLWNQIIFEVANLFQAEGKTLPVYRSSNLPGNDQLNESLEEKYRARNPLL